MILSFLSHDGWSLYKFSLARAWFYEIPGKQALEII